MANEEIRSEGVHHVLLVDDDPIGLRFLKIILERAGFAIHDVGSAQAARAAILEHGRDFFDCAVADYRMPVETGLDLLRWIRQNAGNLSTIIVTAEGNMGVVQTSMRSGAVDYLEKPVQRQQLVEAVHNAIQSTKRMRQLETARQGVMAVGKLDTLLRPGAVHGLDGRLQYVTIPRHEVGGDFLNVLPLEGGGLAFVLGDVSGHDVRAAFVSSFFQGMARGLLLKKADVGEIVPLFNQTLHEEWNSLAVQSDPTAVPIATSLALCAGLVRPAGQAVQMLTCGLPTPAYTDATGRLHWLTHNNPPLGWFSDFQFEQEELAVDGMGFLYVATDGVYDEAADQNISVFSLIFRLLDGKPEDTKSIVANARDDIFLMRFQMEASRDSTELPQPIIYENYTGSECDRIDELQKIWRRSLQFALPHVSEERIYDILLCCREAALNALVHGCERSEDKSCAFQVSYVPSTRRVVVRIDDPGMGHTFDIDQRVSDMPNYSGQQMGLAIITRLSDECVVENKGASVCFSFDVPAPEK